MFAGDEDVEEGEGHNENSGESDEAPPKVNVKDEFSVMFKLLFGTVLIKIPY